MVLVVNLSLAFCSVKVPPTRAKSPKFTSSRRKSCSDTAQTPEGKNTSASSVRSHRHSIGSSKDANRVQCSPKNGVATKTRAVKPELKALWRTWSSQALRLSLYKPNYLTVSHFHFSMAFCSYFLHQTSPPKEGCRAKAGALAAGPYPFSLIRPVLVRTLLLVPCDARCCKLLEGLCKEVCQWVSCSFETHELICELKVAVGMALLWRTGLESMTVEWDATLSL